MDHFLLFIDAITLLVGFGFLFSFTYLMTKSKDRLMFAIWLFLLAFTLDMSFNTVYFYLYHNLIEIYRNYFQVLFIIQIIIGALLIVSIPYFITEIIQWKYRKSIVAVFLMIAVAQLISSFNPSLSGIAFRLAILLTIFFSLIYTILLFNRIENRANRKLIIRILSLSLMAFLANLIQMFGFKVIFRMLVPAVYVLFCVTFFVHFVENYFKSDQFKNRIEDKIKQLDFTKREREVVNLVLNGFSNQKIAKELHISLSTVKSHVRNSFQKANVNNRYEFIHFLKFS